MKSPVIKHAIRVDGPNTSITLEDAFWSCLKEIAQAQGATLSQTVTEIDRMRRGSNLSSAIRLFGERCWSALSALMALFHGRTTEAECAPSTHHAVAAFLLPIAELQIMSTNHGHTSLAMIYAPV